MINMHRSFFRMQPESKKYFTQWMHDVWRSPFLFWAVIAGFVTIFPTLYIPNQSMAKQALDQKISLEQCLVVCHQLLNHMEEVKSMVPGTAESMKRALESRHLSEGARILGPRLTADAVKMCIHNLGATAQQLQDLCGSTELFDESGEAEIIQQLDSARKCLNLVEKAQEYRINSFENIAIGDGSLQTVVSTMVDLIRASGLNAPQDRR